MTKEEDKAFTEFELMWASPNITDEEKLQVINMSNQMLRVTLRSRGYFVQWKEILQYYLKDSIRSPEYTLALKLIQTALDRSNLSAAKQNQYLENTWAFLRKGQLNRTMAFAWYARPGKAKIEFEPTLQFRFTNVNIVCATPQDSMVICNTSGTYYPFTQSWVGHGGKSLWTRSAFPPDKVFAQLKDYQVDMNRNQYTADSAILTNEQFFDVPVPGTLQDQLVFDYDSLSVRFPVFTTAAKRLTLRNMMSGVRFVGGCMMEGSRLVGIGTTDEPILFHLEREGKRFLEVQTEQMAFTTNSIASDFAKIVLHINGDSLYHSGLRFEYNDKTKRLRLRPTDLMITRAPLYSSYHNMTIHFDELSWQVGDEKMVFGPRLGSKTANAFFKSTNYFDREEFDLRMGFDNMHPIFALNNYSLKVKSRTFTIKEFASYIRHTVDDTRVALMRLAVEGFLLYDIAKQSVTLQPALFNQVLARASKVDYDVIQFSSSVEQDKANATLDVNNLELDVYSVSRINVSDSQNVSVSPKGRFIKMKKNRSFEFDGEVVAGLFTFRGEKLSFNYDNYTIDLKDVDVASMQFQLDSYDLMGRRERADIFSQLRNLTGMVHIDKPNNKSGLVKNPEYPIFESTDTSYVYYDKPEIYGGVYNKKNFYFEIRPFVFYNLNNFEVKDIVFGGKLYSDNIFAPFEDTLKLQPDRSLGLVHPTGPDGMALYQGKGKFYNNIMLSNAGLMGDGTITYITSTTASKAFNFFPDSTLAVSNAFNIAIRQTGVTFPDAIGTEHPIRWLPKKDIFFAYRGPNAFSMYRSEAKFYGDLTLQPVGLTGKGLVDMTKAKMNANHFQFAHQVWHADTMDVQFFVPGSELRALASNRLKGRVNYKERQGHFWRIGNSIHADLEALKYACHADRFIWFIDSDELQMKTNLPMLAAVEQSFTPPNMLDRDSIPSGTILYSTVPEEDSLYFMAPAATYYLRNPHLKADSVPYILVADAVAQPHKGIVHIEPEKRMLPLPESKLEASVFNRFHHIYDANLSIYTRHKYAGKGKIDYHDHRDSVEVITLDSIYITEPHMGNATQAYGYVTQDQKFKLSPRFRYEGRVTVDANEPFYYYVGGATPIYACEGMVAERMAFKSRLNPDSLYIPVVSPSRDINDGWLVSGTVVAYDSTHVYPAFMTPQFSFLDKEFSKPVGFVTFNERKGRFIIADSLLFQHPDSIGQRIEFSPSDCRIFTDGRIQLPFDLGRVQTHSTGRITHDISDSTQIIRLFTDLQFHFSPEALQMLSLLINNNPNLDKTDPNQEVYLMGLKDRLPKARYERIASQIELFGERKEPIPELTATLSIEDLQLRWDQANRSLVSVGRIGLGSINGTAINKKINGYLEIFKRVSGDNFVLYLEPTPGEYYIFTFTGITMYANSSNQEYLKIINKTARRKRRLKADGDKPKYLYRTGSNTETYSAQKRYQQLKNR